MKYLAMVGRGVFGGSFSALISAPNQARIWLRSRYFAHDDYRPVGLSSLVVSGSIEHG